jgi:hypothetical protein
LIGAPLGIALIAGLAIPGIICGVPIFIGRKTYQRFSKLSRTRRHLITAVSVVGSLIVSPVLAVMAVGVGVPIMLAYVYGVVPLSLCRDGGCGAGRGDEAILAEAAYGEEDDEFLFLAPNSTEPQETERLLHTMRLANGESAKAKAEGEDARAKGGERPLTGIIKKQSNNMSNDASSASACASSTGRRHNRRQSTESGLCHEHIGMVGSNGLN